MDEAIVEAGWEVRQDEAIGQVYYWNSITGETSWEPPPHLAAAVEEFPSTSDMTPPWTQGYDDSGRLYYLNTETMETRWTPPDEHQEEGEITSNTDVLAMTGGRGRRPSTAEQMDELNRLLSGEGEDEDEEEDPPEGEDTVIDLGAASELPPQVLNETPQEDGEACPWLMFVNEDDGVPYYYNSVTGECLWDPPEEFLRYHQEQEQEQPQFVEIGDATGSNIEDIQAQQETGGSTSKAGSRASSARPGSGMMQAEITPEFEEKVRQAIAAASSTPVGSSRLVLVRTPKQFAPRTGRSAGDDASARSIPNSGRPRSGASRPSSGGAVSRPRTPGGGPASSRIDPIPVPEGPSATPQEKVSPRFAEDDPQNELVGASEEEVPLASEDDEQDQRRIEDLAMESDTELGNYEQPTIRAVVIEEAEENTGKYVSGPLLTEDAFNEADGQIDAVERAVSLGNEAESHLIESTVDTPFGDESDSQLEPDTAEVTLDSEDEAPAAEFQLLSDMVEEISSDTGIAVDIIPSERIDEYPQQRVKRRRETQHHVAPPDTLELLPETESRRAFGAEKQRLLAEKLERDNQRDHEIAEEKRARIQAQRERDAKRSRNNLPDNEADPDRLVWQHVKAQGRPTEQNVSQFRDALAQALDSAQFPNNMCAERARELHERIGRLRRASWALDSQLESVELRLLSELHPLTNLQRPLQAKHAANLRRRLENKLNLVQSWQRVLDEWETSKENGSTSRYWDTIKSRYAPSSATFTDDKTRRHYVLNAWRGAVGGDSLLHVAAWNGWEEHVRLLIEEGADVNLIDCSASLRTPLHEACRAGHSRVVELLLRSGARLSAVDVSGDSPLHAACRGGWTRVVRILLMAANDLGDDTEQESLTLEDFFNLCNGKGRRAIEVATLPSLVEELENYDYQLNGAQQHNGGKHKQVKR
ncbi:hypothetical protein PF010_g10482 [Phytophthora fragariae]|uniref:WW domain-containing protein n=1 Tax=Phytophthora fragariae TaxID=53985 RepID=A0A6G0L9M6_9STRA|nr:hypothetical protein PF010_g10482 [Phytophthora fragariae]